MESTPPSLWLLGRVIARRPRPLLRRVPIMVLGRAPQAQLPWIVHFDETFVILPDRFLHRLPLSAGNTRIIDSINDGWLALDIADDVSGGKHTYYLRNLLSGTTVPLPGLGSTIGHVAVPHGPDAITVKLFQIRKGTHVVGLSQPGKSGAWKPKPRAKPYARIFDIVFLGDNLYGVTEGEGLVMLDLDEEDDGSPTVAKC